MHQQTRYGGRVERELEIIGTCETCQYRERENQSYRRKKSPIVLPPIKWLLHRHRQSPPESAWDYEQNLRGVPKVLQMIFRKDGEPCLDEGGRESFFDQILWRPAKDRRSRQNGAKGE